MRRARSCSGAAPDRRVKIFWRNCVSRASFSPEPENGPVASGVSSMFAARKSAASARRVLLCSPAVAIGLAFGAIAPRAASAQERTGQERTATYNIIRTRSLASALLEYGRVSGVQIIFDEDLVRGRNATPLHGTYSATEALDRLLEGSGLVARRTPTGAVMIVREGSGPQSEGAAAQNELGAKVEDVVVTGSRIRGAQPTAPVHTVSRDDIDRSGYGQIGDVIRSLPQTFGGGQNPGVQPTTTEGGANLSNASTVNLRGIGPDATLVLLNGRRLVADGTVTAPDISAIPLAAVSRVEIITDGASALYGSDAVAGVANFITRDDYTGAEISARLGGATQGGGFEQTYSVLAGRNWDGGNIVGAVQYIEQDPILASERDVTAGAGATNTLLSGQRQTSLFASFHQDLGRSTVFRFDGLYSDRTTDQVIEYDPGGYAESTTISTNSSLLVPSIEFALPAKWTATLVGTIGRSANTRDSLSNGGDVFQSNSRNEANSVELNTTGTLFALPGGEIRLASGAGYREETQRRWTLTAPESSISRDVRYLFGELSVPLVRPSETRTGLHQLHLSLAARYEDYSDIGDTTTPKVGIRYVPINDLALRATWGESFKAPTFPQMTLGTVAQLRNAISMGSSVPGTALYYQGGSRDLKPEQSESWTVGFDWTPRAQALADISLTYFNIDYTDRVVGPIMSVGTALSDPAHEPFIIRNPTPAQLADVIAQADRFSNTTGAPYDPDQVVALIMGQFTNAKSQTISGVDVSIKKAFEVSAGQIEAFFNGTWLEVSQQTLPSLPARELTGTIFYPAKNRMRAGLTWINGEFVSTAALNYVSDETDNIVVPNVRISSWTTLDLNFRYRLPSWTAGLDGLEASLSVTNALDEDPPFAAGGNAGLTGMTFDSTNASPIGRYVALTLRQSF